MSHEFAVRIRRSVALWAVVVLLLACGPRGGAGPSTPAAAGSPGAATPAGSSATNEPSPTAPASIDPEPVGIDPGDVAPESPLSLAWKGDLGDDATPVQPAVDRDGRIWAIKAGENAFAIFDRAGRLLETWGTGGSGPGQLNFRHGADIFGGIAFASDGGFYVSESGNRRVQKFDKDRKSVKTWGSFGTAEDQFLVPNAIAIDGADNVYVHDDELAVTKMFTADGTFVRAVAQDSMPFAAVSEDGHVLAVERGTDLVEYGPDGAAIRSVDLAGLVSNPRVADVVVASDGHLWISSVAENGRFETADKLMELDADGRLLHRWDGMAVSDFALDASGSRLYASFGGQHYLAAYDLPTE